MGEDFDQRHHVGRGQFAHAAGDFQMVDQVAHAARRKLWRGGEQQRFHHLREALELRFEGRIGVGVAAREFGDLVQGLAAVLPHEEAAAVGKGGEKGGIFGIHLVAVAGEVQVADDALLQEAG